MVYTSQSTDNRGYSGLHVTGTGDSVFTGIRVIGNSVMSQATGNGMFPDVHVTGHSLPTSIKKLAFSKYDLFNV